jgi:phosphomannomutase
MDKMSVSSLKFGTSGLRGLSVELAGRPAADYATAFARHLVESGLAKPGAEILIGRDFRASSPVISKICSTALKQEGFIVLDCGALPTPALALEGMARGAASLMVTGSHIPADRNGIKFYRPDGEIDKADEEAISRFYKSMASITVTEGRNASPAANIGNAVEQRFSARNAGILRPDALKNMKIGVYQHSTVARDLFMNVLQFYGAEAVPLGWSDAFVPVDTEAVSAETVENLVRWSAEHELDAIVSADGDGDRPLVADEDGMPLRGDLLGLMTAEFIGADVTVTPVTSNSGIEAALQCRTVRTRVGSPFVISAMNEAIAAGAKRVLGFEANGGCLLGSDIEINGKILKALPTRDSFLPILAVLNKSAVSAKLLSKIAQEYRLPFALSDRLENFPVETSAALMAHLRSSRANLEGFLAPVGTAVSVSDIDGLRVRFADGGIIHLRPSGNAPEMRCYVEGRTEAAAKALMEKGLDLIKAWEKGR